jgi:tRNA nucleotidyltransferase/poly(A) polymerase
MSSCYDARPRIRLTDAEAALFRLVLEVVPTMAVDAGEAPLTVRVAGGWVRDKLLGLESDDVDFALNSVSGDAFARAMQEFTTKTRQGRMSSIAVIKVNPDQSKHLETARFVVNGIEVDANRFREEIYPPDSRIPTIRPSTAMEDALRRDFTVNALFYNLHSGEVEDNVGGLLDLAERTLRTPRPALKTFSDDPLRVLRAARFAARFGFDVHEEVEAAARSAQVRDDLRQKVSRERVGVEVKKMMGKARTATRAMAMLSGWGLRQAVLDVDVADKKREEKEQKQKQRQQAQGMRGLRDGGELKEERQQHERAPAEAGMSKQKHPIRLWNVEERVDSEDAAVTAECVRCMRMMHSQFFASAWDDRSHDAVQGDAVFDPPLTSEQASHLLLFAYLTPYYGWNQSETKQRRSSATFLASVLLL